MAEQEVVKRCVRQHQETCPLWVYSVMASCRSAHMREPPLTYEQTLSILFHILIEERENLSLDQELVSYTHSKIM